MSRNLSAATVCLLAFSFLLASCAETGLPPSSPQGVYERESRPGGPKKAQPEINARATHARALKAQKEGRLADARDDFQKLSRDGYILEDHAALGFAETAMATGVVDGVLAALDDAIMRNPDSPIREKIDAARLKIACADEASGLCAQYIGIIRNGKVSRDFEPELLLAAARGKEREGDKTEAYREYQMIYFSSPASTAAEKAEASMRSIEKENAECGGNLRLPKPSFKQKIERVEKLEAARRFYAVSMELAPLLTEAPGSDAPRLAYKLGMALKKTRDKEGARKVFEKLAGKGGGPYAGMAAYQLALIEWGDDQDKQAEKRLLKTLKGKYGLEARRVSNILLGKIYESRKEFKPAQSHYKKALSLNPSTAESVELEWRVGWMEYLAGNHKKAGDLFAEAHKKTPETERDGAPLYWAARSFEKAGDGKKAEKARAALISDFPDTYYGSKLSNEKRVLSVVPVAFTLPPASRPVLDERGERFLKRCDALADLGEKDAARMEAFLIAGAISDNYEGLIWLSDLYRKVNDTPSSIKAAWKAIGKLDNGRKKDFNEIAWKALYPTGQWNAVSKETAERGLDPFLAFSIIRQESLFDPKAVSAANAIGLMQLMPSTAKATNDSLAKNNWFGAVEFQESALFEPETNIRLGVAHFSTLVGKYSGNLVRSIAAYNAGAAAVDKWIVRFGGADDDEFVEMIPYAETRNYVKKVLRNNLLYWKIYGTGVYVGSSASTGLEGSVAAR